MVRRYTIDDQLVHGGLQHSCQGLILTQSSHALYTNIDFAAKHGSLSYISIYLIIFATHCTSNFLLLSLVMPHAVIMRNACSSPRSRKYRPSLLCFSSNPLLITKVFKKHLAFHIISDDKTTILLTVLIS